MHPHPIFANMGCGSLVLQSCGRFRCGWVVGIGSIFNGLMGFTIGNMTSIHSKIQQIYLYLQSLSLVYLPLCFHN